MMQFTMQYIMHDGVPLTGSSCTYGDNKKSIIHKKSILSFVMGILLTGHIKMEDILAGLLTKVMYGA